MSGSPSFVLELALRVDPGADRVLETRFEAARQLYNACLGEALRRLRKMKGSDQWARARTRSGEERTKTFRGLCETFGFSAHAIESYGTACKNACWIGTHLDAHVAQKVSRRAFDAVQQYSFGKRGRPRFKGRIKALSSLEGKSNATGIRWRGDRVLWSGLELRPLFDRKDKHGVQAFALQCRVKYVRLVWRWLRGRRRWYAQLVLEGTPRWKDKNPVGTGVVGLDIGPSTVAAVGEDAALLERFCPTVEYLCARIRRIQRAMDRSRRATNPDNYNPDGTVKRNRKHWVYSIGYLRLRARLADLQRRLAAARKTEHGRLANRVLAMGRRIRAEQLSYRALQRRFGRSVRDRAPGRFVEQLRRKAESAGGTLVEFSTYSTRLSQTCHGCGTVKRKPLSQRIHVCACGVEMQRDLYSAFLAACIEGESLHVGLAHARWPGAEPLLRAAWSEAIRNGRGCVPATFGASRRQSGSSGQEGVAKVEAEACAIADDAGEVEMISLRTPRL